MNLGNRHFNFSFNDKNETFVYLTIFRFLKLPLINDLNFINGVNRRYSTVNSFLQLMVYYSLRKVPFLLIQIDKENKWKPWLSVLLLKSQHKMKYKINVVLLNCSVSTPGINVLRSSSVTDCVR